MADVPISDALIDSAQFQIQSVGPGNPDAGLVRLFRGEDGWAEKTESGEVRPIGGPLRVVVVPVNTSELLALDTVPKVLVSAPGSGKVVWPILIIGRSTPGTVLYTITGSQYFQFGVPTEGNHNLWGAFPAGSFWSTLDPYTYVVGGGINGGAPLVDLENQPLQVILGEALTGGNGELLVTVLYLLV